MHGLDPHMSLLPWKRYDTYWYKFWAPLNQKKMYFVITDCLQVWKLIMDESEILTNQQKYLDFLENPNIDDIIIRLEGILCHRRHLPDFSIKNNKESIIFIATSLENQGGSLGSHFTFKWGFEATLIQDSALFIRDEILMPILAVMSNFDDEKLQDSAKKIFVPDLEFGPFISDMSKQYFERSRKVEEVTVQETFIAPVDSIDDDQIEKQHEQTLKRKREEEAELAKKKPDAKKKELEKKLKKRF